MLNKLLVSIIAITAFTLNSFAADITIDDSWINAGEEKTMTSDNVYILDGFVFVEDGAVLNIEAGTVIKGLPGQAADASALVIAKGAKIFANGTSSNPIIFTASIDDPANPDDLPPTRRGLWGGLIVLGKSQINTPGGIGQIEGIPEDEPRGEYGGGDNPDLDDNSGVIRYVSIRHGGSNIGQDNEINGLTLGAVGAGTLIEYVEIFANQDDGVEFFGGTVNTRYISVAFCGDDSYDWDEGYNGKGQFWFSIQDGTSGNRGAETDGATNPEDSQPYATPIVSNVTFVGSGVNSGNSDSQGIESRDNTGGYWYNSIFTDFGDRGVSVEDLDDGEDSRARLEADDLEFQNNIWWQIGDNTLDAIAPGGSREFVRTYLGAQENANTVDNPGLRSISREKGEMGLDPRPMDSDALAMTKERKSIEDSWFQEAPFIGAFGTNNFWIKGWTFLDAAGYLAEDDTEPGVVQVYDTDINEGDVVQWTSDNTYVLNGFVFVEDGSELWIEPGTVVKAQPGTGVNASALIVARGAKIYAEGTVDQPIIFTSILDDVNDQTDLPPTRRGLWGGLIVLGKSQINTPGGVGQIEGIPEDEPRGQYGMPGDEYDVDDNSGVIRYISIRHGGSNIGQDNEINGLTLGAVGAGTTIEYVEVFANQDDGVEFFGGTVNTRYMTVAFCGDDSFDWDEGYNGKGQFWLSLQDAETGNRGAETDGATNPEDSQPYATPTVANVTFIGSGVESGNSDSQGIEARDNTGGFWYNSIFTDFGDRGVSVEDLDDGEDSRSRLENGDLEFRNNIWWNIGDNTLDAIAPGGSREFVRTYLGTSANKNMIVDPQISVSREPGSNGFDPRPLPESEALNPDNILAHDELGSDWFQEAPFIGAFGSNNLWVKGWTLLEDAGFLTDGGSTGNEIQVFDTDINPGDEVTWTRGNTYILNGLVFVEEGASLTIEAGTVVKGRPGQGVNASALIIARGGKIFANGTADSPIIFTSTADDVTTTEDIPALRQGLWGGLIVLGNSTINTPGGIGQIEGIPEDEPRGEYGGDDEADNSGVIKYISIRHGGSNIGQDNEINGLTLGAVGSGTTIDYVEVFANQDDGIEFFGGTAQIKHAVVAFCGDDSFDYDEGYRGKGQFWFTIQGRESGDNAGEFDGATNPEDSQPYALPTVANFTMIGSGSTSQNTSSEGIFLRDNAGGFFYNGIMTEFRGVGLEIEVLTSGEDSENRLAAGDIRFRNNIWWNMGAGNGADNVAADDDQEHTRSYLENPSNNNLFVNPLLAGISREPGSGELDPRPNYEGENGPAWENSVPNLPDDGFFDDSLYVGAFSFDNWMEGWTYMDELGFFGDLHVYEPTPVSVEPDATPGQNDFYAYPNPATTTTDVKFILHNSGQVHLAVYNQMGELVSVLGNDYYSAGSYRSTWNVSSVAPGMYFVKLETSYGTFTQKVIVK